MQSNDPVQSHHGQDPHSSIASSAPPCFNCTNLFAEGETSETPKYQRRSQQLSDEPSAEATGFGDSGQNLPRDQLPLPTVTKSGWVSFSLIARLHVAHESRQACIEPPSFCSGKRKAKSLDGLPLPKQKRLRSEPADAPSPIEKWLSRLPQSTDFEPFENADILDEMSQPPAKRSRSAGSLDEQSRDGSESEMSRDKKYSVYKDVNYPVVLETKGSFMRPSKAGIIDEDQALCDKLFTTSQPIPNDTLFDEHFRVFHSNLLGRSEARICTDLHPRVMPSVGNLYICGSNNEFEGLIEGHNDPWVKSIPFYGPRPQPDHTYGFKWFNFSEQQRRKLNIEPTIKSYYAAREDIYFPFLTGEVKCGKHGLELADRPNTHSMTIALRGFVDIYRRLNRSAEVHRRVLGFSISHDDGGVRIYAHYPEIDGAKTTYWRESLRIFNLGDDKGKERWKCYQFTLNVCKLFALPLLKRLKGLIDELPDPAAQSFELAATMDKISVQSSQDDTSTPESQDGGFKKPGRGLNAELRSMIQSLQRQLEQQRQDAEQQRREAEQQRETAEKRQAELMDILKMQGEQIKQLLAKQ